MDFGNELLAHNYEAEEAFLGSLLYEPDLIKETIVQPFHLSPGKNENLMWTIRDLDKKGLPIDVVLIFERLGQKIGSVGGITRLTELATSVPSVTNFKHYENIILEYYQKRKAHEIADKLRLDSINIPDAVNALLAIEDNQIDDDDGDITEDLVEVYNSFEEDTGEMTGIPSGYRDLDHMTSGFHAEELVIIGARPSVGKTAFALNIANNAAQVRKGKNGIELGDVVAIFSLEMPKKQLLKRFIGFKGSIDGTSMRNARKNFKDSDWTNATHAIGDLQSLDIKIFDKPGVDINYIWGKVRKLKRRFEGRRIIVLIDYLQLIRGSEVHKGNRQQEIGEISRMLKHMARELKVSVVALAQLSRGVEQRQDKRPMMSDLRDSGEIEQDADMIAFLYRDDYYDKESESQNIIEVILAKQRNGPIGTVSLAFVKEYQKFVNIDWGGSRDV